MNRKPGPGSFQQYWYWLLYAGVFSAAIPAHAGDLSATNAPRQWRPIADVLRQWDAVAPAEVERAAEGGESTAQHYLGYCYCEGHRFGTNAELGIRWFERAGKNGYLPSFFRLGLVYGDGKLVPENSKKAKSLITAAAEAGLVNAQFFLGQLEEHRAYLKPVASESITNSFNWPYMFKWYRRAAAQDYIPALNRLGFCYKWGEGDPRDESRSLEYFRRAADLGDDSGALELVEMYSCGIGEPRNEADRPERILLRLIEADPRDGNLYDLLIFRYRNGLDGPTNMMAAVEMYCRGVRAGAFGYDRVADKMEGAWKGPLYKPYLTDPENRLLSPSTTVQVEVEKVFLSFLSLYLKSARGDGAACLKIGDAYLVGGDVPGNSALAWAWFTLAAERNAADGARKAEAVKAKMTRDEIAEAARLPAKISADFDRIKPLIGGSGVGR